MRDMPFPFELKGQGRVGFLQKICGDFAQETYIGGGGCAGLGVGVDLGVVCEPTFVLETDRSPSPSSASTSTLTSSLTGGSGGGVTGGGSCEPTDTVGVATVSGDPSEKWPQGHPRTHRQESSNTGSTENSGNTNNDEWVDGVDPFQQVSTNLDIGAGGVPRGGGGGLEYWDNEHGEDQSILGLIMGDGEDPSVGLTKLLQGSSGSGVPSQDLNFGAGGLAGVVDQGFGLETTLNEPISPVSNTPILANLRHSSSFTSNPIFTTSANSSFPISLPLGQLKQPPQNPNVQMFDCPDEKSHVFNHPHLLLSQLQAQNLQNPSFFLPLQHNQLDQQLPLPLPMKRHNPAIRNEPDGQITELGLSEPGQFRVGSSAQQGIIDQLYKAAELVEAGNPILANEILARLNHQISPTGKPFHRVTFYFMEALRLLLMNSPLNSTISASPFNLLFKIGAYKSFSEISPLVQFTNFTCNQALLEALESFDRIHIVDFDLGYGCQWASFMQELALRKGCALSLKITAFTSPAIHDQLELGLAMENLNHFAREINISLDFETVNLDYLTSASSWPLPFNMEEGEAIAVNLPISSFHNSTVSPTIVLGFIKQLSPKIVVTVNRGCDRTDLPFAHHVLQAFQSYLALLESLDTVNVNLDALQKIETFLVRADIEKLILGHHVCSPEKLRWKTLFLQSGFSPVSFSNFTECQAEWLLKRTLARGFHVEKRQSSLVLYWQRKELVSASAWRC